MRNSKWVTKFLEELELRKLILIYGNIYDYFYYNNQMLTLDEVINNISEGNLIERYYTEEDLERISQSLESEQSSNQRSGYDDQDGLLNVDLLRKRLNNNFDYNKQNLIYIKSADLFFSDFTPINECQITHSVHYLNEFLHNFDKENITVIIVSDRLENFPPSLYQNNPETAVINISYPEFEVRETFIQDHLPRSDIEGNYHEFLNDFARKTSSRTLKEINKIIIKGLEAGISCNSPQEFISYYDFGEEESPWTKLRLEEVQNIDLTLSEGVLGQNEAIDFVKRILVRAKLDLSTVHQTSRSNRPIGLFFFVGPTGVGKTELAKALTNAVFKSKSEFKRFDMSEYKEESSLNKLIGSSPGYVGYQEGGQLTNWVKEHPFSVVLFDEIEKAHPRIWDTFLQVLEDGRLTDNQGRTVHFKETIIIFTSNLGNQKVNDYMDENTSVEQEQERIKELYLQAVKDYFKEDLGRGEILNRIGNNIVPFNHIDSEEIYREITKTKLDIIVDNIEDRLACKLDYDTKIIDLIIEKIQNSGEKFGGRAVINFLETYLINEFGLFYIEEEPDNCKAVAGKSKIRFEKI